MTRPFEDALYLADLAAEVYLVHRRERFRAQQYLVDRAAHTENIHFVKNAVPVEIGGGMDLSFLRLQNTATGAEETLEVEGVFVAIGYQPNTALVAGQVRLDSAGYVAAGEDTKTNLQGVFAAGDLRQKPLRQVVTAAADGAVAAMQAHAACMHQE